MCGVESMNVWSQHVLVYEPIVKGEQGEQGKAQMALGDDYATTHASQDTA